MDISNFLTVLISFLIVYFLGFISGKKFISDKANNTIMFLSHKLEEYEKNNGRNIQK